MGMMLRLNILWLILLQALAKLSIDKDCEDKHITDHTRCYLLLQWGIVLVQVGLELVDRFV